MSPFNWTMYTMLPYSTDIVLTFSKWNYFPCLDLVRFLLVLTKLIHTEMWCLDLNRPHFWWHIGFLTHWGRVTIIVSDNDLSPGRQAIIWTNAGILSIRILGRNFSEILSAIRAFSFNKMHLKTSSAKWSPFCLDLNVLTVHPRGSFY